MENITGFIVKVTPKGSEPVKYQYDGKTSMLDFNEDFIGYFWQMTGRNDDNSWQFAHINKLSLIDPDRKQFRYEKEAIFDIPTVNIAIKAKRGPDSNNRFLPDKFDHLETWYPM